MISKDLIIREVTINDTQALIDLKLNYLDDSKTIPLNLDEYPSNFDDEFHLIERLTEEKNSTLIVATINGELVGNLDINGSQRKRLFHTAWLGMGIHNDWQNKGIGSQLMQYAIHWAKENDHLKLITLEVYSSNPSAIHMYKKHHFKQTGIVENYFCQDNEYIDSIRMVNHL